MKEIELNFKVINQDGLLEYLRNLAYEEIIVKKFHYFEGDGSKRFYIRTEEWDTLGTIQKFLTIKHGFINKENGIKERIENTTPIEDVEYFHTMFKVIGLHPEGSKTKKQHLFQINTISIQVDEWLNCDLGTRVEIEGDEEKVLEFKSNILEFVEEN